MKRAGSAALAAVVLAAIALVPQAVAAPLVRAGEVLRGDFVQERILEGFDAPLRSTGRFVLAPGRGLIWRTIAPFPVDTVVTPDGLVQKNEDTVFTRLSAARTPLFGRLYEMMDRALHGDWQAFEERYHVGRSEDGGRWRIELTPRDGSADAVPFTAVVISGARFAESVEVRRRGGNAERLRFTNQTLSTGPLSPEEAALLDSVEK